MNKEILDLINEKEEKIKKLQDEIENLKMKLEVPNKSDEPTIIFSKDEKLKLFISFISILS